MRYKSEVVACGIIYMAARRLQARALRAAPNLRMGQLLAVWELHASYIIAHGTECDKTMSLLKGV